MEEQCGVKFIFTIATSHTTLGFLYHKPIFIIYEQTKQNAIKIVKGNTVSFVHLLHAKYQIRTK